MPALHAPCGSLAFTLHFTTSNPPLQTHNHLYSIYSKNLFTARELFFLLRIARPILRNAGTSNSFVNKTIRNICFTNIKCYL